MTTLAQDLERLLYLRRAIESTTADVHRLIRKLKSEYDEATAIRQRNAETAAFAELDPQMFNEQLLAAAHTRYVALVHFLQVMDNTEADIQVALGIAQE